MRADVDPRQARQRRRVRPCAGAMPVRTRNRSQTPRPVQSSAMSALATISAWTGSRGSRGGSLGVIFLCWTCGTWSQIIRHRFCSTRRQKLKSIAEGSQPVASHNRRQEQCVPCVRSHRPVSRQSCFPGSTCTAFAMRMAAERHAARQASWVHPRRDSKRRRERQHGKRARTHFSLHCSSYTR